MAQAASVERKGMRPWPTKLLRRGDPRHQRARARREAAAAAVPDWFHSIDLGYGVVTPGNKSTEVLEIELEAHGLPDLAGKSVLDIGAWDGYFSFEAERRGAARVVAVDHYAWSLDLMALRRYVVRCHEVGIVPAPHETVPEVWRPDTLPGKQGFDTAHRLRRSRVEAVVGDFMTMDLQPLGRFDLVLFLGVLYHLEHPFAALKRLAGVTSGLAIIETACVVVPEREHHALWEFFPGDELNGDASNWWAPNAKGLVDMCRAAGFRQVELRHQPPHDAPPAGHEWHYGRAIVHASVS